MEQYFKWGSTFGRVENASLPMLLEGFESFPGSGDGFGDSSHFPAPWNIIMIS